MVAMVTTYRLSACRSSMVVATLIYLTITFLFVFGSQFYFCLLFNLTNPFFGTIAPMALLIL